MTPMVSLHPLLRPIYDECPGHYRVVDFLTLIELQPWERNVQHLAAFECGKCGSTFSTERGLLMHMDSHRLKTLPCPECDREVRGNVGLRTHLRRVHGVKSSEMADTPKVTGRSEGGVPSPVSRFEELSPAALADAFRVGLPDELPLGFLEVIQRDREAIEDAVRHPGRVVAEESRQGYPLLRFTRGDRWVLVSLRDAEPMVLASDVSANRAS